MNSLNSEKITPLTVRYSDVDSYGHVSSSRYLDFVNSSIWNLVNEKASLSHPTPGAPAETFSLFRAQMDFKRAVIGNAALNVHTRISGGLENATRFELSYEITNADKSTVFNSGKLEFVADSAAVERPLLFPTGSGAKAKCVHGTPIVYEWNIDVRHNDLDISNRVDASQYLEYVISARWQYLQNHFGVSAPDFVSRGIGFYLTRADMSFLKPISGISRIRARSWVADTHKDSTELEVPFEIVSTDGSIVHSQGHLYFTVINLEGGKPKRTAIPDWVKKYFFERATP